MTTEKIYCYVTSEQCRAMKTAGIGDEIDGVPVETHGDYNAWTLDEEETNAMVFATTRYRFRSARSVQRAMGWQVNLAPIRERLAQELTRIIGRDNEAFSAADVLTWMDACVDEADVACRNHFAPVAIAEDLARCYCDEREADAA